MPSKRNASGEPVEVRLIDRDGNETTAADPGMVHSLVYGHGYRVADDEPVEEAAARLAERPDTGPNPGPIDPPTSEQG